LEVSRSRAGNSRRPIAIARESAGDLCRPMSTSAHIAAPRAIKLRLPDLALVGQALAAQHSFLASGGSLPPDRATRRDGVRTASLARPTPSGTSGHFDAGRVACVASTGGASAFLSPCPSTGERLMSSQACSPSFVGLGLRAAGCAAGSFVCAYSFGSGRRPAAFSLPPSRPSSMLRRLSSAHKASLLRRRSRRSAAQHLSSSVVLQCISPLLVPQARGSGAGVRGGIPSPTRGRQRRPLFQISPTRGTSLSPRRSRGPSLLSHSPRGLCSGGGELFSAVDPKFFHTDFAAPHRPTGSSRAVTTVCTISPFRSLATAAQHFYSLRIVGGGRLLAVGLPSPSLRPVYPRRFTSSSPRAPKP